MLKNMKINYAIVKFKNKYRHYRYTYKICSAKMHLKKKKIQLKM